MIIAVDFDGTVVEHMFPLVGQDVPDAVDVLQKLVAAGHSLILWTMRSDDTLQDAVDWFAKRNIPLYGIQTNPDQNTWTTSPKAYAQIYIDDAALGCPLRLGIQGNRPMVHWSAVHDLLAKKGAWQ